MLDEEGWFPTRDLAHLDEHGYLFICGRADDTIIRGGENIAPGEIEDVLIEHEDVIDVGVLGVPDLDWGQRIRAVVVVREGADADPEALRCWVRERRRGSRTPDEVVIVPALPYSATGKLLRKELAG
jgi:acyl-CoA synthetase (AMP-forming)/AMP-acid ligase II